MAGHRPGGQVPSMAIKVYVVFQRINVAREGESNCKVIATKLTRRAAQELVDIHPGTWVEKHVATK